MSDQSHELKYRISKYIPIRFRNAVLHQFNVFSDKDADDNEMALIRLSYYHLKQQTTLNFQYRILLTELNYSVDSASMLAHTAKMMVREIKRMARAD